MATNIAYPHCTGDASKSALPQFSIQYKGKVDSFVAQTQMDTGEIRLRQRYSTQKETVNATLILTHEEMDFWRNWVLYVLKQGTQSFMVKLPLGGNTSGDGVLVEKEVNIVGGGYSHSYLSHLYHRVTFSLELLDTSTISPDVFSVYTDLSDPSDPCDNFNLLEFENATTYADTYTKLTLPYHIITYFDIEEIEVATALIDTYTRTTLPADITV